MSIETEVEQRGGCHSERHDGSASVTDESVQPVASEATADGVRPLEDEDRPARLSERRGRNEPVRPGAHDDGIPAFAHAVGREVMI